MDVTCSNCNTEYEFDDALVSDAGTSVRCTQCGHRFKVRRRESSSSPEVWIVRTVDGQTLEFRALRELKVAISGKKVGRDDVLSRGAGRPRRLASIAELEPFFGSTASEANRARAMTPAGIGPADARGSHFDLAAFAPKTDSLRSVNVPPPTPEVRSKSRASARAAEDLAKTEVRETNPFLDEDEVTRSRQYTRELHQLGEAAPVSIEPRTEPEPSRFRDPEGPKTVLGVAPEPKPSPESLGVTMPFGTPKEASSEDLDGVTSVTNERRSNTLIGLEAEAEAALSGKVKPPSVARPGAPVKAAEPAKPAVPATPVPVKPPTPKGPVYAGAAAGDAGKEPSAKPLHRASVPPKKSPSVPTPKPPPAAAVEPEAPSSGGRPNVLPPPPVGPEVKAPREPSPMITPPADEPKSSGGRGRPSAYTPTPSDVRYSLADDAFDDRRTSAAATSRRTSSSSVRLIVALLIGGGLIFVGILVVARFVKKGDNTTDAPTGNIDELLAAADAALRDGDVLTASDRIAEARRVDDNDPKVAKASAKVLVSRAEIAWLELLLIPSGDAGRSAIYRRYQTDVLEAQKQADRAALLAPGDLEVARIVLDVKRLTGDTAAAGRLKSSVDAISGEPDTQLSIGALDMLSADTATWPAVLAKLAAATAKESQAGRGRALFIYALARANDPARARKELDELAMLRRPHPLEAALRRFVERIEKGEKIQFRIADLPTPNAAPSAKPNQSAALKTAEDALSRRDFKKAEALFQEVLNADPENADALVGLAQISKQAGNTKQSLTFLERAIQKNPDHARALVALADAKWDAGDLTAARPIYKRAVDAGASGPSGERAKQRALVATASTGTEVPIPTSPTTTTTVPTTTTTTTSPTTTTGGGEEPPPFGQDPPPPKTPQPAPQPTNPVPGAPI